MDALPLGPFTLIAIVVLVIVIIVGVLGFRRR
jgi:hypothetical protein